MRPSVGVNKEKYGTVRALLLPLTNTSPFASSAARWRRDVPVPHKRVQLGDTHDQERASRRGVDAAVTNQSPQTGGQLVRGVGDGVRGDDRVRRIAQYQASASCGARREHHSVNRSMPRREGGELGAPVVSPETPPDHPRLEADIPKCGVTVRGPVWCGSLELGRRSMRQWYFCLPAWANTTTSSRRSNKMEPRGFVVKHRRDAPSRSGREGRVHSTP